MAGFLLAPKGGGHGLEKSLSWGSCFSADGAMVDTSGGDLHNPRDK